MKVLFIEPKRYFDRLIDSNFFANSESTYGVPFIVLTMSEYLLQYDLVVTCIEHSTLSRKLIRVARGLNIDTVLIMDGTFEYKNSLDNPYLKKIDYQLLKSSNFSYIYSPDLMMKKYIECLGSKFMFYIPKHAKYKGSGVVLNEKILITTANSPYFDDAEFNSLVSLIENIVQELNSMGVSYKFRVYDKKLINSLKINEHENDIDEDISTCLDSYTHVITTPSTLVYTAVLSKKPVGLLVYRDVPITQPAGWLLFNDRKILKNALLGFVGADDKRIDFQSKSVSHDNDTVSINEHKNAEFESDFINVSLEYFVRSKLGRLIKKIKSWSVIK